jgi:anti-anti-sigma factor
MILEGDVDLSDIRDFREKSFELVKNTLKDLVIDFTGVRYLDSSGIGILLTLNKMQKGKGRSFRLVNCSENIVKILELSSLSEILGKE